MHGRHGAQESVDPCRFNCCRNEALVEGEADRKSLSAARARSITTSPRQLSVAASTGFIWEKFTLAVDSGASDIAMPTHLLNWCAVIHTSKG